MYKEFVFYKMFRATVFFLTSKEACLPLGGSGKINADVVFTHPFPDSYRNPLLRKAQYRLVRGETHTL